MSSTRRGAGAGNGSALGEGGAEGACLARVTPRSRIVVGVLCSRTSALAEVIGIADGGTTGASAIDLSIDEGASELSRAGTGCGLGSMGGRRRRSSATVGAKSAAIANPHHREGGNLGRESAPIPTTPVTR